MNYIILNGKISTNITGLLIQNLPPISKPLMRSEIEEIDGRDGDIVTKLGYSAYDKTFQIGLYDDFDIDEIIAFFNSEGTVTFSNEEDKYYNYQILEQIDFEKLLRFRTATVKMHVQPFKYSTQDSYKSFDISTTPETIEIRNVGNIYSKPILTVYGSGVVNISLNGSQVFMIDLTNDDSVTIDTSKMEAYNDTVLKNRIVTGDYDNFKLNVGKNTLTLSGEISQIDIENYSRWI